MSQVHVDEAPKQAKWTCVAVTDRVLVRVTATAWGLGGDIWGGSRQGRSAVEYIEYPTVTVARTPLTDLAGLAVTATGDINAWRPAHGVRRV